MAKPRAQEGIRRGLLKRESSGACARKGDKRRTGVCGEKHVSGKSTRAIPFITPNQSGQGVKNGEGNMGAKKMIKLLSHRDQERGYQTQRLFRGVRQRRTEMDVERGAKRNNAPANGIPALPGCETLKRRSRGRHDPG